MATDAQIAANQSNARLSTGPRTTEGKARVALNSVSHGFRSEAVLLPGEDPAAFEALRGAIHDEYFPEGYEQTRCADEMAAASWRLHRARAFQQDVLSRKILELQAAEPALSAVALACRAEEELHRDSKFYVSLIRYEARFDRQYERARRTLLQSRRAEERSGAGLMNAMLDDVYNAPMPTLVTDNTSKPNPQSAPPDQTPRSAPCPCGSGQKYKRCCGQGAPPVLCA